MTQAAADQNRIKPKQRVDTELEEFRSLMQPPGSFDDGFSWAAFLGALFVALMMVPGSIYMTLIAGMSVGSAAQWVTVILFIEIARRANKHLRRAEIFTLFYLSGAIMGTAAMAQGSFHGGLGALWSQFFAQSDAARAAGIDQAIPNWVVPTDPHVLQTRSLLQWEWLPAILLVAFTMIIGRIDNMILGYGLFRLTSDIEKLPFPMAPIGAQGIMALSEEQDEETAVGEGPTSVTDPRGASPDQPKSWRWRVFSVGSVIGLVFGFIYLGIPTITGALLDQPIRIIPLPFIDYTQQTANILPATAVAISLDLGSVIFGMVMPFWAVMGTFGGLVVTFVLNPILYNGLPFGLWEGGILRSWNPGDNMQVTYYKNFVDFYFSFSLGVSIAIALVGFYSVFMAVRKRRKERRTSGDDVSAFDVPAGRGDIPAWLIGVTYIFSTALYIGVSMGLLMWTNERGQGWHWPVFFVMCFYAFIYTPVISYVTARLEGIAGQVLNIPFVREASFILTGYRGVAIWFLPIPLHNYGAMTVFYRQCELTGTSFRSIWKAEILLTPIVLIGSLGFAHFIWGLAPIPSPQYLYAQEFWEVTAAQQALVFQATLGGFTEFEEAINKSYIAWGGGIGLALFAAMGWAGLPTFFIYGIVRGLGQTLPFGIPAEFVGALVGRYYFQKRLGLMWRQYIPVVAAGFFCGVGLVGTLGIGFTFLAKAVFKLPY